MGKEAGVGRAGKLSRMEAAEEMALPKEGGGRLVHLREEASKVASPLKKTAEKLSKDSEVAPPVVSAKAAPSVAEVSVAAGDASKAMIPPRAAGAASHLEPKAHKTTLPLRAEHHKASRKKRRETTFTKLDTVPEHRVVGPDESDEDLSGEFITSSDPYTAP